MHNHYDIISNDLEGKLLPGHRELISSFPGYVNASSSAAKRKNKTSTQRSRPAEVDNTEITSAKLKEGAP